MLDDSTNNMQLREPCSECTGVDGRIETRGGQDTVWCVRCGKFQYNAPRVETGRDVRSLRSRPSIPVSRRSRVFERCANRCQRCGRSAADGVALQLAHIIPVKLGREHGVPEFLLHHEQNLTVLCDECNIGEMAQLHPVVVHGIAIAAWQQDDRDARQRGTDQPSKSDYKIPPLPFPTKDVGLGA